MLDWWLPENVSTYGRDIDRLFHLIYWITGLTFILVSVTMIVFLVMYRDRPGRRARYTHGSTPLEIAWTVVPSLILVVLTFLSAPAWSRIKMSMPPSDLAIEVIWTSGGLSKLEVYRKLDVREVWIWKASKIEVFTLRDENYVPLERSELLPDIDLEQLLAFVDVKPMTRAVTKYRAVLRAARQG